MGIDDEKDMVLIGYLAFLDPPKESAAQAISQTVDAVNQVDGIGNIHHDEHGKRHAEPWRNLIHPEERSILPNTLGSLAENFFSLLSVNTPEA